MISRRLDVWEEGSHARFVGHTESEEVAREASIVREEGYKEFRAQQSHATVMSGNMCQDVRRLTAREGQG